MGKRGPKPGVKAMYEHPSAQPFLEDPADAIRRVLAEANEKLREAYRLVEKLERGRVVHLKREEDEDESEEE